MTDCVWRRFAGDPLAVHSDSMIRIRNLKILFYALGLVEVIGCAGFYSVKPVTYSLIFDDPPHIRFQGKGAAAGMMMSSSMGPMGIAIGLAIDEGIAKDIQAALDNSGCSFESTVAGAFEQASERHRHSALKGNSASNDVVVIRIHRIGFKVVPGEADPAYVALELSIRAKGIEYSLHQPADNFAPPDTVALDHLKINGEVACRMLHDSLKNTFDRWYEGL